MKLVLCDDEPQFLNYIEKVLRDHFDSNIEVISCTSYIALQIILEQEHSCDLLLMDIRLPEGNGIDFAREILEEYPALPVIFISGYADEYYQQAFLNIRPYGFLRKPVNQQLLFQLIQKVQEEQRNKTFNYDYFKTSNGLEKIMFDDIYFLENSRHKVNICTKSDCLSIRATFEELLSRLPSDSFVQCHRSYIVNLNHVQQYKSSYFIMEDNSPIKITPSHSAAVRERFFQFMSRKSNK